MCKWDIKCDGCGSGIYLIQTRGEITTKFKTNLKAGEDCRHCGLHLPPDFMKDDQATLAGVKK